ncbi:MAG TPA: T9SS type A sorting domain-containing protein, partial [Bacteroidia bacterium]|nr:T9SS type A sorting domain-containing protein [Bacteroidia bacterium]
TTSTTALLATDSTSTYTPGGPSATAQTWNFGALNHEKVNTISFMAPSSTKYASKFSSSDNLADTTSGVSGYYYFDNSASQFAVQGVEEIVAGPASTSFQIFINLNPEYVQATLPATYGTKLNGVSHGSYEFAPTGVVAFAYDSIKVNTQISYWDTVDAYGTMTTPTGTYQVIRENHWDITIDSAKGRSSAGAWSTLQSTKVKTHEYNWYANGVGYILVQMIMDSNTSGTKIVWDSSAPASVNEISYNGKVNAFPNPCTSNITFTTTINTLQYINVYDVTGRKVEQVEMKNGTSNLNTSVFAPGMYLYTLNDANGNLVDRGKFMVK